MAIYEYKLAGVIPIEIEYKVHRAEPDVGIMGPYVEIECAWYDHADGKREMVDIENLGLNYDTLSDKIWEDTDDGYCGY